MSVLKDIKTAVELRLRRQSDETLKTIREKAVACIEELHRHGSTVQQVTVRRDGVTIDIDQPGQWICGAIHVVRINGRYREVVKVTLVLGCQVQWIEREEHPLLRREG